MAVKVGINGFGRIGRLVYRAAYEKGARFDVVAINDLFDPAVHAHLLKYDSVHGRFPGKVETKEDAILVDGREIKVLKEKDPANLPWKALGVDIVIEATGVFTKKEQALKHIENDRAKKVIITAPADGADGTFVIGVNEKTYDPQLHQVICNASCTTNGLAPVAKVLLDNFGIKHGLMTTVHAYTNDQRILDLAHKDLRRARAAAMSMIPTKTGAAKAIGLVIPELDGKMDGIAVRVPVPNVSLLDLTVETEKEVTKEAVLSAFRKAASGEMKGILDVCDEPLVSIDFNHSEFSSVVYVPELKIIDKTMVKVLAWYDNEWAYSMRVVELAELVADKL